MNQDESHQQELEHREHMEALQQLYGEPMNIIEVLQDIQANLAAPKGQRNDFGKYNYRSCEDILNALKPLLAKHNAVVLLRDELVLIGERYYIKATASLHIGHDEGRAQSIDTTAFARESLARKGMDESQITGSASSYARKYALNALFAIDDTKDADATNKHQDEAAIALADQAKTALEKGDWAALVKIDSTEGWADAWGLIDTRKKSAMKKLMAKRDELRDALNNSAENDDELGAREIWEDLSDDGKRVLWPALADETHKYIKQLKAQ